MNKNYDIIIIGQGLAGTALSFLMIQQKKKVLVINKTNKLNCPSHIAAGVYSPVAGQRIAKAWLTEEIFSYVPLFYRQLETALNTRFFYPMPCIRLCHTTHMQNFAQRRLEDQSYKEYLSPHPDQYYGGKLVPAVMTHKAGYVDLPTLQNAYEAFLKQHQAYLEDWFDVTDLELTDDGVRYKDIHAKQLVFCTGLQAADNPYFADLPFNPVKGEILTVKMPLELDHIITTDIFVLPLGNGLFRVGATYDRKFTDPGPTEAGKQFLCKQLELLIDLPSYELIDHQAGIRPTTVGHRPFAFRHEQYPQLAVLSGLGSKGVSLAPYMAKRLMQEIIQDLK